MTIHDKNKLRWWKSYISDVMTTTNIKISLEWVFSNHITFENSNFIYCPNRSRWTIWNRLYVTTNVFYHRIKFVFPHVEKLILNPNSQLKNRGCHWVGRDLFQFSFRHWVVINISFSRNLLSCRDLRTPTLNHGHGVFFTINWLCDHSWQKQITLMEILY